MMIRKINEKSIANRLRTCRRVAAKYSNAIPAINLRNALQLAATPCLPHGVPRRVCSYLFELRMAVTDRSNAIGTRE